MSEKFTEVYKVGDVIRFDRGPTALMEITEISNPHGGSVRYYGKTWHGSTIGVYQYDAIKATERELVLWGGK